MLLTDHRPSLLAYYTCFCFNDVYVVHKLFFVEEAERCITTEIT